MKSKRVQDEVDQTLKVFDDIQRVEGNPYLLTRIKAQLAEDSAPRGFAPAFRWLALVVLIVVNSLTVIHWFQQESQAVPSGYDLVADSYDLNATISLDDLLNP